jgi:hypothetical protein
MKWRAASWLLFSVWCISAYSVQAAEIVCGSGVCQKSLLVSEEDDFCARIMISTNREGKLADLWFSGIETKLASRLSGETCSAAKFFRIASKDADYVVPAIKALSFLLKNGGKGLARNAIEEATFECLIGRKEKFVSRAEREDSEDGGVTVYLVIDGCNRDSRFVEVTFHSKNRVSMAGFLQPHGAELNYRTAFIELPQK